jgi:ATP-dependent DNA ligase
VSSNPTTPTIKLGEIKMSVSESGKGSKPRPFSVTQEEYTKRWDMIFGRDLKEESEENKNVSSTDECSDIESKLGD